MKQKLILIITIFVFYSTNVKTLDKINIVEQNWPFNGFFGRFDKSSLQRGFQVYREVCASCHGLKHVS